jgi:hypothetical protein
VAWTRSAEAEHEEMGPAASALGAGEVVALFVGGSREPEPEASCTFFIFRLKGQWPVKACVWGTTAAGCVATACQDLPYKGAGRWAHATQRGHRGVGH